MEMVKQAIIFSRIGLVLIVFTTACQEHSLTPPKVEGPVFWVKGDMAETEINLEAGINRYFMSTAYQVEADGEHRLSSTLSEVDCLDCPESLSIEFLNVDVATLEIDELIKPQTYPFHLELEKKGVEVEFVSAVDARGEPEYFWDFGDGSTSREANPKHIYETPIQRSYEISLKIQDSEGCETTLNQSFSVFAQACKAHMQDSLLNDSTLYIESASFAKDPPRLLWSVDNVLLNTDNQDHISIPLDQGIEEVCLTIIGSDGCKDTQCRPVAEMGKACESGFWFADRKALVPPPKAPLAVRIVWKDEAGLEWRSDMFSQATENFVEVLASSPYEADQEGNPTRKLSLRVKADLYNEARESISFESSSVSWAIAFPE